ncbi:uncharacterized protein LOC110448519 isoform X3 [Mizuhopecten yessoensis]|uniref:uncharacterized protein LOC110448519 isoform X3 n=1 Tax=Mizuhopecten yessoensis TaxID=6573 RepID=UPI000B459C30|nr:uncharacterized protein LOC110448519 isoform X3 [Mizuhopecten yessoensis]
MTMFVAGTSPEHTLRVTGPTFQDTPPPRPPKPVDRQTVQGTTGQENPPRDRPPQRPPRRVPSVTGPGSRTKGDPPLSPKPGPRSPRVPSPPDLSDSEIEDYTEIDDIIQQPGLTDDDKSNGYVGVQTKEAFLEKVPEKHKFTLRNVHKELMKLIRKKKSIDPGEQPAEQAHIKHKPRNTSISNQNIGLTPDQVQSKSDSRKWFESLKPNDLYHYLTELKLDKMAITCRDEGLNGKFFNSITDKELEVDFRLTGPQRLKFRSFQVEGWMPSL